METDRRRHTRVSENRAVDFTVLYVESSDLKRISSAGQIVDSSPAGIGMVTAFPLEPGHVLEWDDDHRKGSLHIAIVRWSLKQDRDFRAGLMLI